MKHYIITAFFLLSPILAAADEELKGKVIWVTDGDIIGVLIEGKKKVTVRLNGIDAPEIGQDYSAKAKQALSKRIHEKQVTVKVSGKDKHGRSIGDVFLNKEDINLWLVANGYAWHYKRFSKDVTLANAEVKAQDAKIGLWSMTKPMAPWDYRRKKWEESERLKK